MNTPSSRSRLEQALTRIADPAGEGARACLTVYADPARAAADAADARAKAGQPLGPLDGAIVSIKDLYDVAGEVTRAGSKVLASEGLRAAADAPVVPIHLPLKDARAAWTEQFELVYVKALLAKADGNVTRAAELAGINRRSLQRLVASLGIRSATTAPDRTGDEDS